MLTSSSMNPADLWSRLRDVGNWADLRSEVLEDLQVISATVEEASFPGALLPVPLRRRPCCIYAVTANGREWRTMRPWLMAYAGPTVSEFTGQAHPLDSEVPAERLFAEAGVHAVAKLEASAETDAFLRRSLRRLCETVRRIPERGLPLPEPRHLLLRRCFDRIASGDLASALNTVTALRSGLHLDTLNLAFLEIHARVAVGDWVGIARMRDFSTLLQVRKPAAVAASLHEAVYRDGLAELVDAGKVDAALTQYQEKVRPRLGGGVPKFPPGEISAELARLHTLDALSRDKPNPEEVTRLATHDLGPLKDRLQAACAVGKVAGLEPATAAPPTGVIRARTSLIDAGLSGTLEAKRTVLAMVSNLSASERAEALGLQWLRHLWEDLVREVGPDPPADWAGWLARLDDPAFREVAADVAHAANQEWSHRDAALPQPEQFADRLRIMATGEAAVAVRAALPHFVGWLVRDPDGPRLVFRPLYLAVVDVYTLAGEVDGVAREATLPMIEAALATGASGVEYCLLLEQIEVLSGEDPGVFGAWWALKASELLRWYEAPDTRARFDFWHRLLERLRPVLPRLTEGQRRFAQDLAQAANWPWPGAPETEAVARRSTTLSERLAGKTVAIYSLSERAADRAAQILAAIAPGARIELLADHVASPRLTALAKNSDLFVMVTAAAKHGATDAIRRARPSDKALLMPAGKGASSILEAIEQWAGVLRPQYHAHPPIHTTP